MKRLQILCLFSASLMCLPSALGATQTRARPQARARAKAHSFKRYFVQGHKAVVNGGVPARATITSLGWMGRALGGFEAGKSRVTVVDKGMVTHRSGSYVGQVFGISAGFGPQFSRLRAFGKRGMSVKEMLPKRESALYTGLIREVHEGTSRNGSITRGWAINPYARGLA
ncbi:MAG: hypothetical protein JRH20_20270 [Deltaproteobacteria bacterium]|nr:hypothetical protein [Deltaproteobacteria bacterium]